MKRAKLSYIFLFLLLLVAVSSCRLGEVLSEADPETQAEIDKSDTIPPLREDLRK